MTKAPPNIPDLNDRCKMRGDSPLRGTVVSVGHGERFPNWCRVVWDGVDNPMLCHLFQLEKVEDK